MIKSNLGLVRGTISQVQAHHFAESAICDIMAAIGGTGASSGGTSDAMKSLELPIRDVTGCGIVGKSDVMDPTIAAFRIKGLASATFTPFNADGTVNLDGIEADAEFLSSNRIMTVFINGTSGESMSLSTKERIAIAEAWVAAAKKRDMTVVNHVSTPSVVETAELAAHAEAIGCDAIALMPPIFFKPKDEAHLVSWMKVVADKAPKMPVYYYHFPVLSGVNLDVERLLTQVEEQGMQTFRGKRKVHSNRIPPACPDDFARKHTCLESKTSQTACHSFLAYAYAYAYAYA